MARNKVLELRLKNVFIFRAEGRVFDVVKLTDSAVNPEKNIGVCSCSEYHYKNQLIKICCTDYKICAFKHLQR